MQASDILAKVKDITAEYLGLEIEEINDDHSFVVDLNADSLDIVELTIAIEEEFEIEISDEEAEEIDTVGELVALIERKL